MPQTLEEAWKLGWRIRVRCRLMGEPYKHGHRNKIVLCDTTAELDMKTLVWTRGDIPLGLLRLRLKCPKCGNRDIAVFFDVPNLPQVARA